MTIRNKLSPLITIILISCISISSGALLSVNAQPTDSENNPILLVHGYGEKSNVWNWWLDWLGDDNFSNVYTTTFTNDRCGSVEQHANELQNIIDNVLNQTDKEEVNIVAHSKGGLDARWYIANNDLDKVANLIMIGTPNAGSPAAWWDISGCPSGSDIDLFPGSDATNVADKPQSTNYYAITGNWLPFDICPFWIYNGGSCIIPGPDDGFVPVSSVNPENRYIQVGPIFPYHHLDLLNEKDIYQDVVPILER